MKEIEHGFKWVLCNFRVCEVETVVINIVLLPNYQCCEATTQLLKYVRYFLLLTCYR
jgi:hypothetical protein